MMKESWACGDGQTSICQPYHTFHSALRGMELHHHTIADVGFHLVD